MQEREIFFERHPDPMWVFDAETLFFLDVNDAAIKVYGYSREEFLAMKLTAIRPKEDIPLLLASLAESRTWEGGSSIWRHLHKSGKPIFAQINAHHIQWRGRSAVMSSLRNITAMVELDHERVTLLRREEGMRKAAESLAAQLAEQNANLRTIQRLINIGTWKFELWSDTVIWSPEIHEMYGVPPGTFGETLDSYMALIHPADRVLFLHNFEEFERTGAPLFEFQHRTVRPDGRMIYVRGVAEVTQTPKGRLLTGVTQDITRRVDQSQRLHLLDLSVGRLNDVVLILEAGEQLDGDSTLVVYANPAFFRYTGLSASEVLGRPVSEVMAHTAPGVPQPVLTTALQQTTSLRSDIRLFTRSGQVIPAEVDLVPVNDPSGVLTHWVAVIRDMSERQAAEERARANEDRYQRLARSTQDVVWDFDLAADTVNWNENYRQLAGEPGAELIGVPTTTWTGRVHPEDYDRVIGSFYAAAESGEENWSCEYRFMQGDSHVRYVFDRGYFYRDDNGKAVRAVGSMVDVTSQKLVEMRLQQTEKLEALGQITGGVAHDFNNLLTIIIGNTETLLDRAEDPRERRLLELMASASERGRELTGRLLAFARRLPLKPVVLDINEQVTRSAELLRRTLPSNIRIEVVPDPASPRIRSDPGQLELVLLNLAVNARDAIQGEGVLTFSVGLEAEGDDMHVVLSVSDTGKGMDSETLRRCMEPFFTTKAVGEGVGLGLSMAFGFMAQSSGLLRISSEPGNGTRVSLIFPQTDDSSPPLRIEDSQSAIAGGDEHVLLVEDDPGVREHVSRMLAELGYQVTAHDTADAAIGYLRAGGTADLLLTDLVMPGKATALQLVEEARATLPGIAVLITSGYPKELAALVEQERRLSQIVNLLPKPYKRAELAATVRGALDGVSLPQDTVL